MEANYGNFEFYSFYLPDIDPVIALKLTFEQSLAGGDMSGLTSIQKSTSVHMYLRSNGNSVSLFRDTSNIRNPSREISGIFKIH